MVKAHAQKSARRADRAAAALRDVTSLLAAADVVAARATALGWGAPVESTTTTAAAATTAATDHDDAARLDEAVRADPEAAYDKRLFDLFETGD